nr:23S rRNA (cytidine(2498)-2'-O)-methyltransferase RlmM [Oleiagrimonas sp. C23AA]
MLAYCRPGFEGECAAELGALDATHGGGGYARAKPGTGFVEFVALDAEAAARLLGDEAQLIFARQLLAVIAHVEALPREDRLGALARVVDAAPARLRDVRVEAPDSDDGRALAPLCRALTSALVARLKRERRLDAKAHMQLHVCLLANDHAVVAVTDTRRTTPWPGGIPRLRFPRQAPSRSTLKLEEAFLTLLSAKEREKWLAPGMRGVDLGAAPGGWTWQLVNRSMRVIAVDNGPMDRALMESGLVEHRREDGFRFQPAKPVDWMVCDMVEQPIRVAARMAEWLARGWCRQCVFNLKLPMKKRYDEVMRCLAEIRDIATAEGGTLELRAHQLYHDREEITVFARLDRA